MSNRHKHQSRFGHNSNENRSRLERAQVYVIVDAQMDWPVWEDRVKSLIRAGVDIIQLRDKMLTDRQLLDRSHRLRVLVEGTNTLFVMNDRADLAYLSSAHGLHVGQDELTVADARAIVGAETLIGVSTHTVDQASRATEDGADYIGVGPTFPSRTKQFQTYPGLDLLRKVAGRIQIPAFAIGGIDLTNLAAVRDAGFRRVAVQGAIQATTDLSTTVQQIKRGLSAASTRRTGT